MQSRIGRERKEHRGFEKRQCERSTMLKMVEILRREVRSVRMDLQEKCEGCGRDVNLFLIDLFVAPGAS